MATRKAPVTATQPGPRLKAVESLKTLAKVPGMLRLVTAEHLCAGGPLPTTEQQLQACDAHEVTARDPQHFAIHDIVALEEQPDGTVMAHTAEGDWVAGYPEDLLPKLLEVSLGRRA